MMRLNYLRRIGLNFCILIVMASMLFTSCGEDHFEPSILDLTDDTNASSASYEFDLWLRDTYLKPYNIDFRYKLQDVSADMEYNLVPAYLEKSQEMAILIDYLWFGVYDAVAGADFLKENGPRVIQLIGSAAYNVASKTKVMGTAENGIVVTLYDCNAVDRSNITEMNEYYFNTMHHEFAHILHQKKTYPTSFEEVSKGKYAPVGWENRTAEQAAKLGFVSPYAGSQPREDFVETISNYLTKSDSEWNLILEKAKDPANTTNDDNYMDGRYFIRYKLSICASWLKSAWGIDIHTLRAEIQERQTKVEELFN